MRTLTIKFTDNERLKKFIDENEIANYDNVLVQIFSGICDVQYLENLITLIKKSVPHIKILGSTTDGEIMDGLVSVHSSVLSFSIFENTKIVTHSTEVIENESYKTAENLIQQFDKTLIPTVAITFADGLHVNGENYLNAFSDYNKNLVVAGGLAGDNATFVQTIVFTEKGVLTRGAVVALLYNNELIVTTRANYGWTNIGKNLTITKAIENVVYEIDHIKMVDIYAKYLGKDVAEELPKTGIEFPLIIKRDGCNIARAVLGKNEDGSLIFAGNLQEGDIVTFGYGNIDTILSGVNITPQDLLLNPIESIFIYSCMARKALLGESVNLELDPLNKIAPVSGFFTYGEFYHNTRTSKLELLNQTKTVLALSENKEIQRKSPNINNSNKMSCEGSHTLIALSQLISQTSHELEELNENLERRIKEEVEKNRQKDALLFQHLKLAAMGEMIGNIAHQWRQPLQVIAMNLIHARLDLDEFKSIDTKTGKKLIHAIEFQVEYLSKTIDDFRDFFNPKKEKETFCLDEIIQYSVALVRSQMKKENIEIVIEQKHNDGCSGDRDCMWNTKLYGYPRELSQVLVNLFSNSKDVFFENKINNPVIRIYTTYNGEYLSVSVSDNGGGISEKVLPKVFEPYFTTKHQKKGTGIGLYMSRMIVEEHHGGLLNVANNDEGAVFTLSLPIV